MEARTSELAELSRWSHDPAPVALISGSSGSGRTRLAREAAQALPSGWCAYTCDPSAAVADIAGRLKRERGASLIVVDDAASRREVAELVCMLTAQVFAHPVKALLVVGDSAAFAGWAELPEAVSWPTIGLRAAGGDGDRRRWFVHATQAFAARLGIDPPDLPSIAGRSAFGEAGETILITHLRALLALRTGSRARAVELRTAPVDEVLAELLEQERQRWRSLPDEAAAAALSAEARDALILALVATAPRDVDDVRQVAQAVLGDGARPLTPQDAADLDQWAGRVCPGAGSHRVTTSAVVHAVVLNELALPQHAELRAALPLGARARTSPEVLDRVVRALRLRADAAALAKSVLRQDPRLAAPLLERVVALGIDPRPIEHDVRTAWETSRPSHAEETRLLPLLGRGGGLRIQVKLREFAVDRARAAARSDEDRVDGLTDALVAYGRSLLASGEPGRATAAFREAQEILELDPAAQEKLAHCLHALGTSRLAAGNAVEAIPSFGRAATLFEQLAASAFDRGGAAERYLVPRVRSLLDAGTARLAGPEPRRSFESFAIFQAAVLTARQLVDSGVSAGTPMLAAALCGIGDARRLGGRSAEAIDFYREAVDFLGAPGQTPDLIGDDELAGALMRLGTALVAAGRTGEARPYLGRAEHIYRSGVADRVVDSQRNLAQCLLEVAASAALDADEQEARRAGREAVTTLRALSPTDAEIAEPLLARGLSNLAWIEAAQHRGDEAVRLMREAVATYRRLADRDRPRYAQGLGICLGRLALYHREYGDFQRAVRAHKEAVEVHRARLESGEFEPPAPASSPALFQGASADFYRELSELKATATMWASGPSQQRDPQAMRAWSDANQMLKDDPTLMSLLARAMARHQAATAAPSSTPSAGSRPSPTPARVPLAVELDEAIAARTAALGSTPPTASAFAALAALHLQRSEAIGGTVDDLDRAIEAGERACAADDTSTGAHCAALVRALVARFERRRRRADLDRAVAVRAHEAGEAFDPAFLVELSSAWRLRGEALGSVPDLTRAVEVAAAAVAGDGQAAERLHALAAALLARNHLDDDPGDLDDAVRVSEAAVAHATERDLHAHRYLDGLAAARLRRFAQQIGGPETGGSGRSERPDRADLERADDCVERALVLVPAEHPERPGLVARRCTLRHLRYRVDHDADDLERAVVECDDALATLPKDHPARFRLFVVLGHVLVQRFADVAQSTAECERAFAVLRRALRSSADRPEWAEAASRYGELLVGSQLQTHAPASVAPDVRDAFHAAASTIAGSPSVRFRAAMKWSTWALTSADPADAVAALDTAAELVKRRSPRGMDRRVRAERLVDLGGLGQQAVTFQMVLGRHDDAVWALERNRGVLLGELVDTRAAVDALRVEEPAHAASYERLCAELDAMSRHEPQDEPTPGARATRRLRLTDELERLSAGIRQQPGGERFGDPPEPEELRTVCPRGPVVLVGHGSALIVTTERTEIVLLPRAGREIHDQSAAFDAAVRAVAGPGPARLGRKAAEEEISRTLEWLWDCVAEPVLKRLEILGRPKGPFPRVQWCPVGLLTFLPLHAAGHHVEDARFGACPRTVMDRVISSYIPSVRVLRHALGRARIARRAPSTSRGLVVSMPQTPQHPDLPTAAAEASAVAGAFPGDALVLTPPGAVRDRVLGELRDRDWAHFACHGIVDMLDPEASRLLLHDHLEHPLTVRDIAMVGAGHGQLAFLSACSTSHTATRLADETISLSSAFLVGGYPRVVATLWPLRDKVASRVSSVVYAAVLAADSFDAAASGLHDAVRSVRDEGADFPSRWAGHVYSGA